MDEATAATVGQARATPEAAEQCSGLVPTPARGQLLCRSRCRSWLHPQVHLLAAHRPAQPHAPRGHPCPAPRSRCGHSTPRALALSRGTAVPATACRVNQCYCLCSERQRAEAQRSNDEFQVTHFPEKGAGVAGTSRHGGQFPGFEKPLAGRAVTRVWGSAAASWSTQCLQEDIPGEPGPLRERQHTRRALRSRRAILRVRRYMHFANASLRIFASKFTRDIGLSFSFLCLSSSGFAVRVIPYRMSWKALFPPLFSGRLRGTSALSRLQVFDGIHQGGYVGLAFLCEKSFNCSFNFLTS